MSVWQNGTIKIIKNLKAAVREKRPHSYYDQRTLPPLQYPQVLIKLSKYFFEGITFLGNMSVLMVMAKNKIFLDL